MHENDLNMLRLQTLWETLDFLPPPSWSIFSSLCCILNYLSLSKSWFNLIKYAWAAGFRVLKLLQNNREHGVSMCVGRRVGSGQNRKSSSARFKVEGFRRRVSSLYRLHFLLLHSFIRMLSSEGVLTWTRTQTREHDEAKTPKTHFNPQKPPLCQLTLNDAGEEDGVENQGEVILF